MKIIDVSMNINENMQVYKNKKENIPIFKNTANYEQNTMYQTWLGLDLHTGTHADMPLHMIKGGHTTNEFDLYSCIREVNVIDLSKIKGNFITIQDIKDKIINKGDFIFFKTRNSFEDKFNPEFVAVEGECAQYLAKKQIVGIGIDALGIERNQPDRITHKAFLSNNIVIIEGLRLKSVEEKKYFMIALPIKIDNVEAAPMRVILIENFKII